MTPIRADDAQRIFEALASVEAAKSGRDFVYVIELGSGETLTGCRVVERTDEHLGVVIEDPSHNRSAKVAWDDIASVKVETD